MSANLILEPYQYRIRGNWIHFPNLDLEPVQIPFGLLADVRRRGPGRRLRRVPRPGVRLKTTGRKVIGLWMEIGGAWQVVLPTFARRVTVRNRRSAHIVIEVATTDAQRKAARGIVKRTHYLNPRNGGLILLATIEDKIVGTLQIERLMHGHPFGRDEIFRSEGLQPPGPRAIKRPGFRRRVVGRLGLYWISRVAVERAYRSRGVGSALCDAAREVVERWMLEPRRYVELIRKLPITEFEAIHRGKSDFLTGRSVIFGASLAYSLRTPYLSRKKGGACLAYYFSKAGPMVIPTSNRVTLRT